MLVLMIIICLALFSVGYSFLYYFILPDFLAISIVLGIISGIITTVVLTLGFVYLCVKICKRKGPKSRFTVWFFRLVAGFGLMIMNVGVKYEGLENVPRDQTFVLYPNHKSFADCLYVFRGVKQPLSFMGKKEIDGVFLLGDFMDAIHGVYLDRNSDRSAAESMIKAIKNVKEGISMCIFPEGGIKDRSVNEMVEIKAGAYKLAQKPKALVIPVSIKDNHLISKRSPWKRTRVIVRYHKPITYEEYKDMNTQQMGEMVFEIVNNALK